MQNKRQSSELHYEILTCADSILYSRSHLFLCTPLSAPLLHVSFSSTPSFFPAAIFFQIFFCFKVCFAFNWVSLYRFVYMRVASMESSSARVTGNCEFPNTDAWNWTRLLYKVRKCSYVEPSLQSSDSFSLWLSDSSDIDSESQCKRFSWKTGNPRTVWAHCCAHAHSPVLIGTSQPGTTLGVNGKSSRALCSVLAISRKSVICSK